ncbi:hypothetical protein TRIUR3_23591 [Triticum urartu]|uniref:Uncharacterized protein n=1 Tax=Triticum urartu TaxID=4572 RepID=M7Z5R7_TRIUA|nr:hypothetical protein TRIUR3_23591 [Triticum urartu]
MAGVQAMSLYEEKNYIQRLRNGNGWVTSQEQMTRMVSGPDPTETSKIVLLLLLSILLWVHATSISLVTGNHRPDPSLLNHADVVVRGAYNL